MKKNALRFMPILGAMLLVGAGCTAKTTVETTPDAGAGAAAEVTAPRDAASGQATGKIEGNVGATVETEVATAREAASGKATGKVMATETVIKVSAKQFAFEPAEIRVKEGDKVKLEVTSVDVDHGIAIPAYNINKQLKPGTTTTIEFTADQKGSFPFFCSVFCGSSHGAMRGTLIVE